ncbi:YfcE family phosphodiesterase [archaeon]|nr:YfcE family phosphodiesterase [archaeon]
MKIVCIGDFHVPDRHEKIPSWISQKIKEETPDKIIGTGDFTSEKTLKTVEKWGELIAVQGNMDWVNLPEHAVLELDSIKIGVIHGKGIVPRGDLRQLRKHAKRMKARVLVHGHTHKLHVEEQDGILFINPGSATGSQGGGTTQEQPSFIIIELNGKQAKIRKITKNQETETIHEL